MSFSARPIIIGNEETYKRLKRPETVGLRALGAGNRIYLQLT